RGECIHRAQGPFNLRLPFLGRLDVIVRYERRDLITSERFFQTMGARLCRSHVAYEQPKESGCQNAGISSGAGASGLGGGCVGREASARTGLMTTSVMAFPTSVRTSCERRRCIDFSNASRS